MLLQNSNTGNRNSLSNWLIEGILYTFVYRGNMSQMVVKYIFIVNTHGEFHTGCCQFVGNNTIIIPNYHLGNVKISV